MGSAEINFVNIGPVTSNLTSISVNPNGTADVTAQVAVDFVAPEGTQVSAETPPDLPAADSFYPMAATALYQEVPLCCVPAHPDMPIVGLNCCQHPTALLALDMCCGEHLGRHTFGPELAQPLPAGADDWAAVQQRNHRAWGLQRRGPQLSAGEHVPLQLHLHRVTAGGALHIYISCMDALGVTPCRVCVRRVKGHALAGSCFSVDTGWHCRLCTQPSVSCGGTTVPPQVHSREVSRPPVDCMSQSYGAMLGCMCLPQAASDIWLPLALAASLFREGARFTADGVSASGHPPPCLPSQSGSLQKRVTSRRPSTRLSPLLPVSASHPVCCTAVHPPPDALLPGCPNCCLSLPHTQPLLQSRFTHLQTPFSLACPNCCLSLPHTQPLLCCRTPTPASRPPSPWQPASASSCPAATPAPPPRSAAPSPLPTARATAPSQCASCLRWTWPSAAVRASSQTRPRPCWSWSARSRSRWAWCRAACPL